MFGVDGLYVDDVPALPIDAVIDQGAVHTVFQPVVHLATATVSGFEALTRGPAGSPLESPLALLAAAKQVGRLGELDWLCRTAAMRSAAASGLPATLCWLINVEPAGLAIECPDRLVPTLEHARAELRVVLEVVEREMQGNVLELMRATDQARRDAWGVALDDVGAEEDSLALLPLLRPDVVKLDMSLVRGLPRTSVATVTAAVRAYAENTGAIILAEGIETPAQQALARVFGATYGQGYYYGRPGPLPATMPFPVAPIPLHQYVTPLNGRTPFEALTARVAPQRADRAQLLHIVTHLESEAAKGPHASVLLAGFQRAENFTAIRHADYRRLSSSNSLTIVMAQGVSARDGSTYYVRPLAADSRMNREWLVILLNAQFAAAFVARASDLTESFDTQKEFDFVYTYDRDAVVDAARCFLQELGPVVPDRRAQAPIDALADQVQRLALGSVDRAHLRARSFAQLPSGVEPEPFGFAATSRLVLDYLNMQMPMSSWAITRVENDRQTYLYIDDNEYGLTKGGSHPWEASYCIHMVDGSAPGIAPDAQAVPAYAAAPVNDALQIGAYAGAPIGEADGTLFGVICGLDRRSRPELTGFGETLTALSRLLTVALRTDRALRAARTTLRAVHKDATTDALTGIYNRMAWDDKIRELDDDYDSYADPTVLVIVGLDGLKRINDGPGGHAAGDQLLRVAAGVMRRSVRTDDFVARIDGDEFGIVFARTSAVFAAMLAERLGRALDRAQVPASIGWSPLLPDGTVAQAIESADRAMYAVKGQRKQPVAG